MPAENVSADLIWEITNGKSSYLVKRKQSGVARFSRDPLNLKNISSRKYDGFVNDRAFGINARPDGKGLILSQKNPEHVQQPAKSVESFPYATAKPARQTYKAIVDGTTRSGYRSDLRAVAVARASAIRKSQTVKKDVPAPKARGKKALSKAIAESS